MKQLHEDEGGQAIVIIAITMLTLLFAVGLAMDVGQLYNGRRTAQEAADAAAFAGAVVVYQSGASPVSATVTSAATADATLNGYSTDSPTTGTTVTVTYPYTFGTSTKCVKVSILTPVRTSLVPQQSAFTNVTATGVACSLPAKSDYALIATDVACDTGAAAISSNGGLAIHGGSVQVNSCGSKAAQNGGTVTLDSGYETDIVGNYDTTGGNQPWPNSHTGVPVQADPFAGTAPPDTSAMTNYGTLQCTTSAGTINQPGIYTSNSPNCYMEFAPGTYVLKGSGISISGATAALCTGSTVNTTINSAVTTTALQNVSVSDTTNVIAGRMVVVDTGTNQEGVAVVSTSGSTFQAQFTKTHASGSSLTGGCTYPTADGGVFFFITQSNYPSTGGSCATDGFKVEGGVATTISAPTSGSFQGMLVWQDKACTNALNIGGGGAVYTNGSIYAPSAGVNGNGNGSTVVATQIIAKTVNTQNAKFTMNYDASLSFAGSIPALVQ